jgi:hypothetical protein
LSNPQSLRLLWEVATPTTVLTWSDDATITEIYPSKKSDKLSARETLITDFDQGSYDMSYMSGHDAFADINNLDHCIKYLNQSLFTFGFPSALDLYSSEPVRHGLIGQFSSGPCKQMYFSWKILVLWGTMFPD